MNRTIDVNDRPDPRELLRKLGKIGIIPIIILLFALTGIFSAFFQVPTEANAVILRFGKYHSTVGPGLHFKIPWGVDQHDIVPVERQLKMEFGFGATNGATNRFQASSRYEQDLEQSMITGDRNAALVEWVVQYRISNPQDYLFRVHEPEQTLRDVSESVMREVVGDRTVDEVITIGRQGIEVEALTKLQEVVDSYGLGFSITQIQLKDVNPPRPVRASFDEVNQAQQERESLINVAKGQYNKAVPKARGQADQIVARAEGEAKKRVNEATGDAERFNAVYLEYEKSPEVTRKRLYLERMADVLPRLKNKVVVEDGASSQPVPLLHLGDSALNPTQSAR
ncbi:MAG: FtsH protease activity modulator HflK [Verrucomicrobiota bacterium JB023]|nr:FtsH protease activity modulator HflK [Verrucomicrobiota bacterium JB023]